MNDDICMYEFIDQLKVEVKRLKAENYLLKGGIEYRDGLLDEYEERYGLLVNKDD